MSRGALWCQSPARDETGDRIRKAGQRQASRVCATPIGETPLRLRLIGTVKRLKDRRVLADRGELDVRQCRRCGWWNIFEPVPAADLEAAESLTGSERHSSLAHTT